MKTEITIDGITYKVGDVLESVNMSEKPSHKIVYIGHDLFMTEYKEGDEGILQNSIISHSVYNLMRWKIKKPKKKVVIEKWINFDRDGHAEVYDDETTANHFQNADRIACEYVRFEYEIDE
jgi:hypothetical protein